MLQSVETSLSLLLAMWGQFVLSVASLGLSKLTMGEERALLWAGNVSGGQHKNSPNGVFIWGREPQTMTAHLKMRAWGHKK